MSKQDICFKKEAKWFNIEIDDIKSDNDIWGALEETIMQMREKYYIDRLEVVLNKNLIEMTDKITGYKTILGCRLSYENLPIDVSFIVRPDEKPTYEQLEHKIEAALEELKLIGDFYTTPIGQVIHLEEKIKHINKAVEILEGKKHE